MNSFNAFSSAGLSAGGSTITTPKVLHVTTAGNDTTGDGSLGAPYLTVDKALQVGASLGAFTIEIGVGSFGSYYANANNWPAVTLSGQGEASSNLIIQCNRDIVVRCRAKSLAVTVVGSGASGTTPAQAAPEQTGDNGGAGSTGPNITLIDCCGGQVTSQGGSGGTGGGGGDYTPGNTGGNGGNGGVGGNGGAGGAVTLINSRFAAVESIGGLGSAGGNGGGGDVANGGSDGSAGASGSDGGAGAVSLLHSHAGAVICDQLYWGGSNISDSTNVTNIASDYGGNSNMPFPSF